jgi:hypothetical protein
VFSTSASFCPKLRIIRVQERYIQAAPAESNTQPAWRRAVSWKPGLGWEELRACIIHTSANKTHHISKRLLIMRKVQQQVTQGYINSFHAANQFAQNLIKHTKLEQPITGLDGP